MTNWLTPPELSSWLSLAELMVKLPGALDGQLQRDAGLSHFEYMVLARLSEAPGQTLRMSALAAIANGSLSRLSHVVKRLEQHGWVVRQPCPGDGRYTNAILTEAGRKKVAAAAPGHVDAVRSMVIDRLDADQLEALRAICGRIAAGLPGSACRE